MDETSILVGSVIFALLSIFTFGASQLTKRSRDNSEGDGGADPDIGRIIDNQRNAQEGLDDVSAGLTEGKRQTVGVREQIAGIREELGDSREDLGQSQSRLADSQELIERSSAGIKRAQEILKRVKDRTSGNAGS